MRPAMTGELVELSEEGMRFVATDGLRLARYLDPKTTFSEPRQLVVPEKAVVALQKLVGDGEATITFGESIVAFDLGDLKMTSRLIKHRYPDYNSVIPLANENEMTIKCSELSTTVKRMSLFSSSSFQQVRLSIDKDNLKVSARDQDKGSNAEENIKCEYHGDPMEIGFNSGYLADALSHFDAEEATFKMHSPTKAAIIVPAESEDKEDLLMLLMPMRLNEDR
jgi:DNA polymerase-3 subunit beta